jgi:hypothetical protein
MILAAIGGELFWSAGSGLSHYMRRIAMPHNAEKPACDITFRQFWAEFYGISYTRSLSAMPRRAACFWIGLIASLSSTEATAGASITGPVA